jgi:myo-inositol-1(or 4)-monophosphatase
VLAPPLQSAPVAGGSEIDAEVWLDACRRMVVRQREIFAEVRGIAARTEYEGVGEGGDQTLVIDRRCEDIVFEELERLNGEGHEFTAVSEERGHVAFGSDDAWVVIDPIDGSLNARRTIPAHCLSVAIATGDSMADVEVGFVHDFGADEEFSAVRGSGAHAAGGALNEIAREDGRLEVVGVESASPELVAPIASELQGKAWRIRSPGAIALSLSYIAAGRFDAMLSGRHCRSVDAAAAQLIVREAGGSVAFGELELSEAGLDLDSRYPVAGALDDAGLATMLETQRVTGALDGKG